MDYVLLTADRQAEVYRNVLLQAEFDNFIHGLESIAAQSALDALPVAPPPPKKGDVGLPDAHADMRAALTAKVDQLQALADAAETRAIQAKGGLDELKQPYVVEDPMPAVDAAGDVVA